MITLIGMGSGTPESLTAQGLAALQNAGLILGAKRLLEQLPQGCTEHRKALYQPEDVLAALAACLLYPSPSPRDRQQSRMPSSA